jgi:hypothetical protein
MDQELKPDPAKVNIAGLPGQHSGNRAGPA